MKKIVGFSLQESKAEDLSQVLFEVLRAVHVSRVLNQEFGFLEFESKWSLDSETEWKDLFEFAPTVEHSDFRWNQLPEVSHPPSFFQGSRMEWYRQLVKEIFRLKPEIQKEVEKRIQQLGFESEHPVIHLPTAATEKVNEMVLGQARSRTAKSSKVFVVAKQPVDGFLSVPRKDLIDELVQISVLSRSSLRFGARFHPMFRLAELLGTGEVVSVLENDQFGWCPYLDTKIPDTSSWIRKLAGNEIMQYRESLKKDRLVSFPFLSEIGKTQVAELIDSFNEKYWVLAVREGNRVHHLPLDQEESLQKADLAVLDMEKRLFSYVFQRTDARRTPHALDCICAVCCLQKMMESTYMRNLLELVTGKKVVRFDETFMSKYRRGDFLTVHHDKPKGSYTFILSLTRNWWEPFGGLTCFIDSSGKIWKTLTPGFGQMTIFRLEEGHPMNHFVTQVTGQGDRISFTGWFVSDES